MREAVAHARELAFQAESADRARSEFLAVMSHELRTPLNGVLGFAELLADTDLTGDQQFLAKTISESGSHLLAIVNDILDFSSIEKGTLEIHCDPLVASGKYSAILMDTQMPLILATKLVCALGRERGGNHRSMSTGQP